jgi:hypothetical protein
VSAAKFIANASHRSGQCSIILILKFLGQREIKVCNMKSEIEAVLKCLRTLDVILDADCLIKIVDF